MCQKTLLLTCLVFREAYELTSLSYLNKELQQNKTKYRDSIGDLEQEISQLNLANKNNLLKLTQSSQENSDLNGQLEATEKINSKLFTQIESHINNRQKLLNEYTKVVCKHIQETKQLKSEILSQTKHTEQLENIVTHRTFDIKQLRKWIDELFVDVNYLFKSKRWKTGNLLIRLIEKLAFRPKLPTVQEHIVTLWKNYLSWTDDYETNSSKVTNKNNYSQHTSDYSIDPLISLANTLKGELPDIIIFPVIDWHFRIQRPQHIATELSKIGHRVFYLSTVIIPNHSTPSFEILETPKTNIFICQLKISQHNAPNIYTDNVDTNVKSELLKALNIFRKQLNLGAIVSIVDLPFWRPLAKFSPGTLMLYNCMDYHAGFSTNSKDMLIEEGKLLQEADLVITTSARLSEKIEKEVPNKLIRNGVEYSLFSQKHNKPLALSNRPVIGYIGAISEWFDINLVIAAAKNYPDWDFILVGSTFGCDTKKAEQLDNLKFVGEIKYEEVPQYVHTFDVCIIPFKIIELTRSTNPVKVYEYLAAGKPVVTTALPELQLIQNYLHLGHSQKDFITKLDTAMKEKDNIELREKRSQWAQQHDWSNRAKQFEKSILELYPKVSIIILTYNNLQFTQACLKSIKEQTNYPNYELIIVDNASQDKTIPFLKKYQEDNPNIQLILNKENLGFAKGNNIGLKVARGEFLIILNNDTYVTVGWITDLIRHLRKNSSLGLIGPITNNIGNEAKIDIHYSNMDEMQEAAEHYTHAHYQQQLYADALAFFCVAMHRTVYKEIGPLDESFNLGFFEDDDYCNRVLAKGYKIAIAEDVFIHHHLSASFSKLKKTKRDQLFKQNKAIYEKKWGRWNPHSYRKNNNC